MYCLFFGTLRYMLSAAQFNPRIQRQEKYRTEVDRHLSMLSQGLVTNALRHGVDLSKHMGLGHSPEEAARAHLQTFNL